MKFTALTTGLLGIALSVTSCGKKLEEGKPALEVQTLDQKEVDFKEKAQLLKAVETGDAEKLKEILKSRSINLNLEFDNGETLLTMAIKHDHLAVRNVLLEKGALVEKANFNLETPLMVAVINNRLNSVKVLLDRNVTLDSRDAIGETALHKAIKLQGDETLKTSVRRSYEELVILLIKNGASIDVSTYREQKNAFKLLELYPNERLVEFIKNIMDVDSGSPDIAVYKRVVMSGDTNNLGIMLSRYPKMANNYDTINPLALILDFKDELAALKSAQILLNNNVAVDGPRDADTTPLVRAAKLGKKGFVHLFLEHRANPDFFDYEGKSALYHAITNNDLDMVIVLLNYSADTKYEYTKGSLKVSFKACKLADSVRSGLKDKPKQATLDSIKDRLGCKSGFFSFL
jgi:ankyrin repeat protein